MRIPHHDIYAAQDLWLEHFRFGQPETPSSERYKYSWEFSNKERSRVLEHTMDAVREAVTRGGANYIAEKIGRVEDNYLGQYNRPGYWGDYCNLNKRDKEILEKFRELEAEKMRPLYSTIKDEKQRNAVKSCMDFAIEVAQPRCNLNTLKTGFSQCKRSMEKLIGGRI